MHQEAPGSIVEHVVEDYTLADLDARPCPVRAVLDAAPAQLGGHRALHKRRRARGHEVLVRRRFERVPAVAARVRMRVGRGADAARSRGRCGAAEAGRTVRCQPRGSRTCRCRMARRVAAAPHCSPPSRGFRRTSGCACTLQPQSRCRCATGEPSSGADAAEGVSPSPSPWDGAPSCVPRVGVAAAPHALRRVRFGPTRASVCSPDRCVGRVGRELARVEDAAAPPLQDVVAPCEHRLAPEAGAAVQRVRNVALRAVGVERLPALLALAALCRAVRSGPLRRRRQAAASPVR